ncbi:hypothetical protein A2765_02230 [Candidatus Kaiserbacteria bacterium RIFCSPHIGHO2_01_FULL_56_24]|uniref:Transcription regulator TrmB N-terminal domain-containing protein n=1 Tax=Candidatus Kaiserbacteria bacterium RIFCSPHIGHO2_01_FULL_56_24 TaxID=1798487 RepID=A0A1F6DAR9_9BACT|nr:MAG: hypothetical protein A2765_02230 [Candidatus Kaiserbacteria bacterium RIFCSPHIGHO2_01_FULL_56_24]
MRLGLSEQRANAYLKLLELGGATGSELAKNMGVQRTSVYSILQSLSQEGLVENYIQKKKQFYRAVPPEKVATRFAEKLDAFRAVIPLMKTMEKKEARAFGLRFIETISELKTIYRDILDEYRGREYRIIGSAPAWEGISKEFFEQYRKDRAARNIKTRLLLTAESETMNIEGASLLREFRYLPSNHSFKSTIDIFEDKILVISPDLSALAVVIAIPAMIDVFSSIFEMLWNLSANRI